MTRLIHGFAAGLAIWGLIFFLLGYVRMVPSSNPVRGLKARTIAALAPIPYSIFWLVREYRPETLFVLGIPVFFGLYAAMIVTTLIAMHALARRWADPASDDSSQLHS